MDCEYKLEFKSTDEAEIPLIEEWCRTHPNVFPAKRYIIPKSVEKVDRLRWLRKGIKERADLSEGAQGATVKVKAFDGQIVRTLLGTDGSFAGIIEDPESAHWYDSNTLEPYSVLYEYARSPYSALIANSPDFSAKHARVRGTEGTEVRFTHPKAGDWSFQIFFDSTGKLIQRSITTRMPWDDAPRVYETHDLHDYQTSVLPSGEAITFPRRVEVRHHVGSTPDGTLINNFTETMRIEKLAFNVPIPDPEFLLTFPSGTKISDRLHALGLEMGPDASNSDTQIGGLSTRWRIILAVHGAILLGVVAFVIARRQYKGAHDQR